MQSIINFLPGSKVEIKAWADQNDWQEAEKLALQRLSQDMETPGFRPGRIPLSIVKESLGDSPLLLEEILKYLIDLTYKSAIHEHNLRFLEPAAVKLPQIEKDGNLLTAVNQIPSKPIEIIFTVTIWPKIKLGDYKKIVKETKSGKTIETAVNLQEAKVKAQKAKKETAKKAEEFIRKTPQEIKNEQAEKILNALVENIQFDLPEVLLRAEVDQRLKTTEEKTKKLGLTLEEYLFARADNLADFKDRVTQSAEQTLRTRIILQEIAKDLKHPLENEKDLGYIIDELMEA